MQENSFFYQIGLPYPSGFPMRVTYPIPGDTLFATDLTLLSHSFHLTPIRLLYSIEGGLANGMGKNGSLRVCGGRWKGRKLLSAPRGKIRPTTDGIRIALFNILQGYFPGCRFLDLFAGTGAVGIEALSRGASQVVFVEKNRLNLQLILKNLQKLAPSDSFQVLENDVQIALDTLVMEGKKFDVIFLDPPYTEPALYHLTLGKLGDGALLSSHSLVIVQARKKANLHERYGLLQCWKVYAYGSTTLILYRREEDGSRVSGVL